MAIATGGLNAQVVQLRPQAGLYLPTRISWHDGMLHLRQKVGVTVGARMTITFNDCFDIVTGVSYIPGYAVVQGAGQRIDLGTGPHLLSAATGARYWLLPSSRMLSWEVHANVGAVFGGQPAYEDLFENSTMSGVVGSSIHYQIRRIVALHLRAQERVYRVRLGVPDLGNARRPFQLSFGLSFPFLESARWRAVASPPPDAIAAAPTR